MNPEDEAILFQETFDIIFQNSMDMIFVVDTDGTILDSNIQSLRYLGTTLKNLQKHKLRKFVKESRAFKEFLDSTILEGSKMDQFTFITKDKKEIPFHVSATLIKTENSSYLVFLCRDIKDMIEVTAQRRFFFELFQHDLLNNLHAEIGYLDFFKRLYKQEEWKGETAEQLLEKMREMMVRSIYLVQNANINLLIQEERPLSKQKVSDILAHSIRYLTNFFSKQITAEITHLEDLIVLGDEYMYRVFVNLIVRMLEYTDEKIKVEIYVTKPQSYKVNIKMHFEGVVLSTDAKTEILEIAALDRKKLDVAVTQNMLDRYEMRLKIEYVKRLGDVVGTRITVSVPVFETD
ncbi:MAG: PAS domain S-box protein [Candidatus Heimdallarchaeota archaeon]|nr:PAS domain S-box protein [Candidatus Heimdallarchaeota archaeon]